MFWAGCIFLVLAFAGVAIPLWWDESAIPQLLRLSSKESGDSESEKASPRLGTTFVGGQAPTPTARGSTLPPLAVNSQQSRTIRVEVVGASGSTPRPPLPPGSTLPPPVPAAGDPDAAHCPWLSGSHSCANTGKNKVFLAVTGLRQRLIFDSTIKHVIKPLSSSDNVVHVYMSLVNKKADKNAWDQHRAVGHEPDEQINLTDAELQRKIAEAVERAGGCLMCSYIFDTPESLPAIPDNPLVNARLGLYQPRKTEVGRNILRVWKARKHLWELGVRAEKQFGYQYAIAMWSRDDTRWTNRILDVKQLAQSSGAARTVWSKNCKDWGGINDKVVLSGRTAAFTMLGAYDSFFNGGPRVKGWNAEEYLKKLADSAGLSRRLLTHSQVPSGDAIHSGRKEPYCFIRGYYCGDDRSVRQDQSDWCDDVFWKIKAERAARNGSSSGRSRSDA